MILRQYLLATGERGLGWEVVNRIASAREFATLELVADRVALASSEEGRKQMQRDAAVRRADALDQTLGADRIFDYVG